MNKASKIYVAGHRGSAIVKNLVYKELDLVNQKAVADFFETRVRNTSSCKSWLILYMKIQSYSF